MNVDEQYKRRIRVEGGMDDLGGYQLNVTDLETGEPITNIAWMRIHLNATRGNKAQIGYYKMDEEGKHALKDDGEPVFKKKTLSAPDIEITAFEV